MKSGYSPRKWHGLLLAAAVFSSLQLSAPNAKAFAGSGGAVVIIGTSLWYNYGCTSTNSSPYYDCCPGPGPFPVTAYAATLCIPYTIGTVSVSGADYTNNGDTYYIFPPTDPSQLPRTVTITATVTGSDYGCGGTNCTNWTYTTTGTLVFTENLPCPCASAAQSSASSLGTSQMDNNSVDFSLRLGPSDWQHDGGILMLKASTPSTNLAQPSSLQVPWLSQNINVSNTAVGAITQVDTPQGLINVHVISDFEYRLECFYASNVLTNTNALYGTNGPAFVTYDILNPNGATNYNSLWITDEEASGNRQYQYTYNTTNGGWAMLEPDNQTLVTTWRAANPSNSAITNSFKTISVGAQLVSQVERVFEYVPGLLDTLELQEIDGTNSATATTTWTYCTNGPRSNLVQSVVYPNGNWAFYQYDAWGRKTNEFAAYENSPAPASGTVPNPATLECKQTEYFYAFTNGGFGYGGDPNNSFTPAETIVLIPVASGSGWALEEVSRTYELTDAKEGDDTVYQCRSPGASVLDANNLMTFRKTSTDIAFTYGLPINASSPNGNQISYSYPSPGTTVRTDPDYSQTTTIVDGWGRLQSVTKVDSSSVVLQNDSYGYSDPLERSYNITDMAGRTTYYTYDCCSLDSMSDPDGVTTTYTYDPMRRRVASSVYYGGTSAITTTNILDGAGRVLEVQRVGTNGTMMNFQQSGYDVLGRVLARTNALGGVTTTSYSGDGVPLCVTNVFPDSGISVSTYFADGRLQSTTGTAVYPAQYAYGGVQDGSGGPWREFTLSVKLTASDGTNEWTEMYADGTGQTYKTLYATNSGTPPYAQSTYSPVGLMEQVDPDGVMTWFAYNQTNGWCPEQLEFTTNDPSGADRITQTEKFVLGGGGALPNSVLWTTRQYQSGETSGTLTSSVQTSADGLTNWQTVYADGVTPVTTKRITSPGSTRLETVTAPDGSYSISVYSFGRLSSVTKYLPGGAIIGETTYGYDAHGRRSTITDARNGTTVYAFNNADQVAALTTPNPESIASSTQTTTTSYDGLMRPTNIIYPDGTALTNVYYPTGLLQSAYGSRAYPVGYGYDAQGRMTSMTNWTNFATGGGARVTSWNYDAYRGFLASKVDAAGKAVSYTYTAAGRLASRAWARGTNTIYSYNTAGDLASVVYSDTTPGVTNTYDRLGRKTEVLCGATTTSFEYDLANDLTSESYSFGTLGGLMLTNQFDNCLRRTNMALLNGSTLLYQATNSYDGASRLALISDGTNSATYSYLANCSLVGQITFASNAALRMTTSKQYDLLNRLTSISSTPSNSFTYLYNAANQRTMSWLSDGSYWRYGYDALGQVTSGNKFWNDETPVAGQQFDYTFDTIGNRTQTQAGGDQNGQNLRVANYTNNVLNQITSRGVPAYVDVMGDGLATNAVTVNGQTAYRKNEYFRQQLSVTNTSAVWDSITVAAAGQTSATGHIYVPQAPENYTYDADGNLLSDGRWTNTWDAENRLVSMTSLSGAPSGSQLQLQFAYDYQGRRIQKLVSTNSGSGYIGEYTNKFAYDGWNCLVVLTPSLGLSNSFLWGSDLSGSLHGAGGVGGLIKVAYYGSATTNCFVAYDGNGNVNALVNSANGVTLANYDYGPFGELLRATGPMAKLNPAREGTKFYDDETDMAYYGYRYYNPSTGRWLSRDPLNALPRAIDRFRLLSSCGQPPQQAWELAVSPGRLDYCFVGNSPTTVYDLLGLCVPLPNSGPGTFHDNIWNHNFGNDPIGSTLTFQVCCPGAYPYLAEYGLVSSVPPPPPSPHGNNFPGSFVAITPPSGSGPCYTITVEVTTTATVGSYFGSTFIPSIRVTGLCCNCRGQTTIPRNDPPPLPPGWPIENPGFPITPVF